MSPKFEPIGAIARSSPTSMRNVAKTIRAHIAIESGPARAFKFHAHRAGEHLGNPRAGSHSHRGRDAVVVEIPEPAGKTEIRPRDSQLGGDVAELAPALIAVQAAGLAHVRNEQVDPAVAVVVAPG